MADRYGFQFPKTILPERWILAGSVTMGMSGVATGTLPIWISSITPTGAANPSGTFVGMYTVGLTDSWNGAVILPDMQCAPTGVVSTGFLGGGGTNDNLTVKVVSMDVASSNKRFVLQVQAANSGTATVPGNGTILQLLAVMSNNGSV